MATLPTVRSLAEVGEERLTEIAKACNVPPSTIEDVYSCTPIQLSMIAKTRDEVLHFVMTFSPAADIELFCAALRNVVVLNAALRTRLVDCEGLGIVQVVTSEEHVTERRTCYEDEEKDLDQYLQDDHIKPKDGSGTGAFGVPLFLSTFIGRSLVVTMHHAIMDYWSVNMLLNVDMPAVCLGNPPIIRPAFKDFVAHYCLDLDEVAAKSFWASRFKGAPAIFPAVKASPSGCNQSPPRPRVSAKEDRKVTLKRMSDRTIPHSHVPYFIEAAWALTAAIYADNACVAYGYVMSGRSPTPEGVEATLGPTITEVPIQINLQLRTMTVERLIKDRAASMRQLQQYSASGILHYSLDRIGALSKAAKTASGFQTLFNIRPTLPTGGTTQEDADVKFERMVWLKGSFPLQLIFTIMDNGVMVWPRTDSAVLSDCQLSRILDQFEHVLHLLTEAPPQTKLDDLQLLDPYARSDIYQWNKTAMLKSEVVEKCLHDVFSAQVRAQPEAIAVEASDGSATYLALDQVSDRLARELQRRGVSPGKPVAFVFEKSFWAIVAILGILKADGACVPIDKNDQYDRKAAIISSARVELLLTSAAEYAHSVGLAPDVCAISATSVADFPEGEAPKDSPGRNNNVTTAYSTPDHLAYILFTSGSTGPPKGVLLEHRSLVSSLTSHAQRLAWKPGCRMLQFAAHVSSSSVLEIFGALLGGGCLCIPSEERAHESHLPAFIGSAKVNWALLPPSTLRTMSPGDVSSLRSLLSTGEHIDSKTYETWSGAFHLFNSWGACEASMLSTVAQVMHGLQYPENIGTPVGCAVWIVNPQKMDELAPFGGVGELVIEGPGVARGYLNDEPKVATSSFISPHPRWASSCEKKATTRFFRTGDLAKYNPDDNSISLVGRLSNRVKLGGHTIQLEEVESVIASCGEVRDIVTAAKILAGRTHLFAAICLSDPQLRVTTEVLQKLPDAYADLVDQRLDAIRVYAQSRLPPDSVPTIWLAVQQLPRTASHKVDRAAIREWLKALRM